MPTYKITAPDGTVYRVTGDGTAEEALAQVQAQLDAAKQNDEPPKKESVSDQLLRGTGLAARVGINAVTAVPAMLADAATGIANLAMPEGKKFKLQGPALNELLTRLGLPAPRNATERVATEGAEAMLGGAAFAKAASKGPALLSPLAEAPIKQAVAGGSSALAGGVSRERGHSETTQTLARIGGAFAPATVRAATAVGLPNTTVLGRQATGGKILNQAAGINKQSVINELDNYQTAIPGEHLSAAGAAVKANAPTLAGIEKQVVSRYRPDLQEARLLSNKAARDAALEKIGGSQQALDSAIEAREAAAGPLYKAASQGVVTVDSQMRNLLARPQMRQAVEEATEQAKNDDLSDLFFRNSEGQRIALVGDGIHYIKKALDNAALLPTANPRYVSKEAAKAALNNQKQFLSIVNKYVPEYDVAKQTFAKMSPPVNQMQVGQFLRGQLRGPLDATDEAMFERAGTFARAVENAPSTIKRSGVDLPRYGSGDLEKVLTPEQMAAVRGVRQSLSTEAQVAGQGSLGSKAASGLLGSDFGVEIPNILHRAVTITRFALERIGVHTKDKALEDLARDLQDPAIASRLMKNATAPQKAAFRDIVRAYGTPASAGLLQSVSQQKD